MDTPSAIILGIDPGTLITGIGIVARRGARFTHIHSATIRTRPGDALPLRLRTIYDEIIAMIDRFHPDECGIETAFYGKNIQSTLKLGHARGVAILAAVHRELAIAEYSPREVKRAVTGNGASSKEQVSFMVQSILRLRERIVSPDASDALAIALCHGQHSAGSKGKFTNWSAFAAGHPERIRIRR